MFSMTSNNIYYKYFEFMSAASQHPNSNKTLSLGADLDLDSARADLDRARAGCPYFVNRHMRMTFDKANFF
jgi:hypothetical protein